MVDETGKKKTSKNGEDVGGEKGKKMGSDLLCIRFSFYISKKETPSGNG